MAVQFPAAQNQDRAVTDLISAWRPSNTLISATLSGITPSENDQIVSHTCFAGDHFTNSCGRCLKKSVLRPPTSAVLN